MREIFTTKRAEYLNPGDIMLADGEEYDVIEPNAGLGAVPGFVNVHFSSGLDIHTERFPIDAEIQVILTEIPDDIAVSVEAHQIRKGDTVLVGGDEYVVGKVNDQEDPDVDGLIEITLKTLHEFTPLVLTLPSYSAVLVTKLSDVEDMDEEYDDEDDEWDDSDPF